MSWARAWKGSIYGWLPSRSPSWHGKRRKGIGYLRFPEPPLECQMEQDRIFCGTFLAGRHPGRFWELGCGDGTTGSPTLVLEEEFGWRGVLVEPHPRPARLAAERRTTPVQPESPKPDGSGPDLISVRRPEDFPGFWEDLAAARIRPTWLIVENPSPSPVWTRRAENAGYRLRWFFHDDEYFERVA